MKYTEGPGDRAWMQEKDRNYLTQLADQANGLMPPASAPQPNDPTGLIAATRQLHHTLAAQIATYDFPTYERIEQQLLDAITRLPELIAAATQTPATPTAPSTDNSAAAAAVGPKPLGDKAESSDDNNADPSIQQMQVDALAQVRAEYAALTNE